MPINFLSLLALSLLWMQATPDRQPATIEGVVIRAGTNEPVANAEVGLQMVDATQLVITNDSGRFRFPKAAAGIYGLSANHDGYLGAQYGARGPSLPGSPLVVNEGQEVKGLVIAMFPTSAISGRVYGPDGDPVPLAAVQLFRPQFLDGRRTLLVRTQARSGPDGAFSFDRLPPGDYVVSAQPLVTRTLPAARSNLPVYFPGSIDPDLATTIHLDPGVTYSGIDINARENESRLIRGRLLNYSGGSAFVTLSARHGRTAVGGDTVPRKLDVTPDGLFELPGVAPGAYDLIVTLGDGIDRLAARANVELYSEDIDDLLLTPRPGFEIQGRVELEGSPPGDRAIRDVSVQLGHEPFIAQVSPSRATVAPDGSFAIQGVIPGTYRVHVITDFDAYVQSARMGSADLLNFAPYIAGADGNEITIRISPRVATVEVLVREDRQGKPAGGVQVVLAPGSPNRERLDLYRTARTDPNGVVRIKAVDPGDYKVFAWEYLEPGSWQAQDFIARYEDLGVALHVGESEQKTAEVPLIKQVR